MLQTNKGVFVLRLPKRRRHADCIHKVHNHINKSYKLIEIVMNQHKSMSNQLELTNIMLNYLKEVPQGNKRLPIPVL
jgi:hypothetical protein